MGFADFFRVSEDRLFFEPDWNYVHLSSSDIDTSLFEWNNILLTPTPSHLDSDRFGSHWMRRVVLGQVSRPVLPRRARRIQSEAGRGSLLDDACGGLS